MDVGGRLRLESRRNRRHPGGRDGLLARRRPGQGGAVDGQEVRDQGDAEGAGRSVRRLRSRRPRPRQAHRPPALQHPRRRGRHPQGPRRASRSRDDRRRREGCRDGARRVRRRLRQRRRLREQDGATRRARYGGAPGAALRRPARRSQRRGDDPEPGGVQQGAGAAQGRDRAPVGLPEEGGARPARGAPGADGRQHGPGDLPRRHVEDAGPDEARRPRARGVRDHRAEDGAAHRERDRRARSAAARGAQVRRRPR